MRAHFNRPIYAGGILVTDATVRVLQPGTTTPITDTLYTTKLGITVRTQPWVPSDGIIDFYLDIPQVIRLGITRPGDSEVFIEDLEVGSVLDWITTVKDFGAKGDGSTDDTAAIQAALSAMQTNTSLYFPDGVYKITAPLILPSVDGITLWGAPASNARRSGATLLASGTIVTIMATNEWYNNVAVGGTKDGQGLVISGISFDGGGFTAGSITHDAVIETTSHVQYCIVIHGSNWKIENCFFNSSNSHGVLIAGNKGKDTTTTINETHEGWIHNCGIRYTGGDGFHAMPYAQDGYVGRTKVQYAGGHGFFIDVNCSAWDFDHNHPSRCARDMFHCETGWEVNLSHNYIDALGDFMDGIAVPGRGIGAKRYGIYLNGSDDRAAHIDHNRMHTEASGGQSDPVVGLFLKGWVSVTYNTLIYQSTDAGPPIIKEISSVPPGYTLPAWAFDVGNIAHAVP